MFFELLEVPVFFSITKAQEQIIIKKKFTVIDPIPSCLTKNIVPTILLSSSL